MFSSIFNHIVKNSIHLKGKYSVFQAYLEYIVKKDIDTYEIIWKIFLTQ